MKSPLLSLLLLFSFVICRGSEKFPRYPSIFRTPFLSSPLESSEEGSKEYENRIELNHLSFNSRRLPGRSYGEKILGQELQRHGTTTLAVKLRRSIIICVDSKASMGDYVGSRTVRKVIPISSHMIATMAGGAADCYHIIRRAAAHAKIYEAENGSRLPVSAIANLIASHLRENRGSELSVGTMIAGFDALKGPSLFYVDQDGSCVEGNVFSVGSGSTHAYPVIDSLDITDPKPSSTSDDDDILVTADALLRDKVIDQALWAVRHATYRDGYSGGYLNLLEVNATGVHHLRRIDCRLLDISSGPR